MTIRVFYREEIYNVSNSSISNKPPFYQAQNPSINWQARSSRSAAGMPHLIEKRCQLQDGGLNSIGPRSLGRVSGVNESLELPDSMKEMKAGRRDRGQEDGQGGEKAGRNVRGRGTVKRTERGR